MRDESAIIQTAMRKGMEKGMKEGKKEGIIISIKKLFIKGLSDEEIIHLLEVDRDILGKVKEGLTNEG